MISGGGVQFTSAGSGVRHSEYNHSKTESLHFLQLWVKPNRNGLDPSYQTVHFTDEEKQGRLCLIWIQRDAADKIIPFGAGIPDSDIIQVMSKVQWDGGGAGKEVQLTTHVTNWHAQ